MVADRVAQGDDPSRGGVEVALHHTHLKEGCRDVVTHEDREHRGRVGTRAIIEGERDLTVLSARHPNVGRVGQRAVDPGVLSRHDRPGAGSSQRLYAPEERARRVDGEGMRTAARAG